MSLATINPLCKVTDIKFRRNPFIGSRADTYEQTDRHADMTKILGAFHEDGKALKNGEGNIN
jgi:hypothetical protein